jgi:hypothetical protein
MAVGSSPLECYQGEDVEWEFTVNPTDLALMGGDISTFDIELVIKASASALNPALIGPVTCTVTAIDKFKAALNVDLDPADYVVSARRVDPGFSWQLHQGPVSVLDSASIDV